MWLSIIELVAMVEFNRVAAEFTYERSIGLEEPVVDANDVLYIKMYFVDDKTPYLSGHAMKIPVQSNPVKSRGVTVH